MTLKHMVALALNLTALTAAGLPAAAQEASHSEYQVKAAYLFNFAKFIEWPPKTFSAMESPLVIGVFGDNPFAGHLEKTLQNKVINNRPVTVRYTRNLADLKGCHILFISASENKRCREVLDAIDGSGVFTVTENSDRFLQTGGMLNLFTDQEKVRFEINDAAARRAGLKISSRLLLLASKKSPTPT